MSKSKWTNKETQNEKKKKLLASVKKSLPSLEKDAEEVKDHCFFKEVDWKFVFEKKINQPFKPTFSNELDLSYFDKRFTTEKMDGDSCSDQPQSSFVDNYDRFTYVYEQR